MLNIGWEERFADEMLNDALKNQDKNGKFCPLLELRVRCISDCAWFSTKTNRCAIWELAHKK